MYDWKEKIPNSKLYKVVFREYWYRLENNVDTGELEIISGGWNLFSVKSDGKSFYENPVMREEFNVDPIEAEWYLSSILKCVTAEEAHIYTSYGGSLGTMWLVFENGTVVEVPGNCASCENGEMDAMEIYSRYFGRCESRWMKRKIVYDVEVEVEIDRAAYEEFYDKFETVEVIRSDENTVVMQMYAGPTDDFFWFVKSFKGKLRILSPSNFITRYEEYIKLNKINLENKFDYIFEGITSSRELRERLYTNARTIDHEESEILFAAYSKALKKVLSIEMDLSEDGWLID